MTAQRRYGRGIAHAIVDAEVDGACLDARLFVPIRQARRRTRRDLSRERRRRSVAAIDEDPWLRLAMREDAKAGLVLRPPHERRLRKVDTRSPSGLKEDLIIAEDVLSQVVQGPVVVQIRRAEVADAAGDIEPARAAEQIVRRIVRLEPAEVHVVHASADTRIVQRCLDDLNLDAFYAITRW